MHRKKMPNNHKQMVFIWYEKKSETVLTMQTDFALEIDVLALSNTRKNNHNYHEWEKTTKKERKWIKAEWNHIWTQKNAFDYLNNQLNPMCNLNLIIHHVCVCVCGVWCVSRW